MPGIPRTPSCPALPCQIRFLHVFDTEEILSIDRHLPPQACPWSGRACRRPSSPSLACRPPRLHVGSRRNCYKNCGCAALRCDALLCKGRKCNGHFSREAVTQQTGSTQLVHGQCVGEPLAAALLPFCFGDAVCFAAACILNYDHFEAVHHAILS